MVSNKERITEPVINIIQVNREYTREYLNRMIYENGFYEKIRKKGKSLVNAHKEIFGRQTYCWNGEFRYWVWDYEKWRIYVSDKQGVQIEVNPDTSVEETMAILRNYWNSFGV